MLSLRFCDIPREGIRLDCAVMPDLLDLSSEEGQVVGQFHLMADVTPTGEGAYVKGTFCGRVIRECIRCLQEYMDDISIQCTGNYHREHELEGQSHLSISGDKDEDVNEGFDEETYPCTGNRLELADMLREHLILATPIQPLCHSDCLGLCQYCGQNLNRKRCECSEKISVFDKFSQIQQLRENSGQTAQT